MDTTTQHKIYQYIEENNGITANGIVMHFNLNATGIFRHLLKLQKDGLVYKIGTPPTVKYFVYAKNMANASPALQNALNWAISGDPKLTKPEWFCQTRDVFQGRTDRLVNDLKRIVSNENLVYLLVAVVGEIGNNSFDHNLGNWQDIPGVYLYVNFDWREIILADRGQGVFTTIKRVKPEIKTNTEALQIAFNEMVSGRAPERRGNGLKFVKKIFLDNNLYLNFYTGDTQVVITGTGMEIKKSEVLIPGTLAYIKF